MEKPASRRIWQAINLQIKPQKTNLIATWLQAWKYALSGFAGLGMLISISLFHQTANAKFGWNVNTNLSKQQITLTATTHQHADFSKVCTLWIKNGEKILLIGSMPETGEKTFKITQKLGKMIKGGELIISIENKQNQGLSPTIIEYQQEWKS
ncbi:MAG: hypothetical protein HAW58_01395 [Candidatus Thioglobus sp.]|nr:hypothetical protein [Candidatus Thioglobus sp.]